MSVCYCEPEGIKLSKGASLDLTFKKPIILMGATGGSTVSRLRIKIDWL